MLFVDYPSSPLFLRHLYFILPISALSSIYSLFTPHLCDFGSISRQTNISAVSAASLCFLHNFSHIYIMRGFYTILVTYPPSLCLILSIRAVLYHSALFSIVPHYTLSFRTILHLSTLYSICLCDTSRLPALLHASALYSIVPR